ncbi:MAG: uncharacterized protein QOG85_1580 [Gaiellaceae bacterium]|jgi:succinate-acetate transporter protein|nr:uncharacterized protein [Gaiellaceae bacterium]
MTETPAEESTRHELERRVDQTVRVVVRPIGSPVSVGFLGLGAASFVLAGLQFGWVGPTEGKKVALVLIAFAFGSQILAGILSFLARDGLTATAMTELGLVWLVVGLTLYTSTPGSQSRALGLFLLFAAASMAMTAATMSTAKLVPALIFAMAALRFLLTGLFELTSDTAWEHATAGVGLALTLLALYAAFAAELEDTLHKSVLPLGRRGDAKEAVTRDTLYEQVKDAHTEPGVRSKL